MTRRNVSIVHSVIVGPQMLSLQEWHTLQNLLIHLVEDEVVTRTHLKLRHMNTIIMRLTFINLLVDELVTQTIILADAALKLSDLHLNALQLSCSRGVIRGPEAMCLVHRMQRIRFSSFLQKLLI